MAASHYFGFAGPQYSAQGAPAYPPPPPAAPAFALHASPAAEAALGPLYAQPPLQSGRAAGPYGAFQAPAAPDYAFGARPPEPGPQPPAPPQGYQEGYAYGRPATAGGYEAKAYYPVVAAAQAQPTEPYYPSGSQSSYGQPADAYGLSQRQAAPVKAVPAAGASSSGYGAYSAPTAGQQNASAAPLPSYVPSPASSPYAAAAAAASYASSPASYSGTHYSSYDPSAAAAAVAAASYSAANAPYYPAPPQPQPPPPVPPPKPLWGADGGPHPPAGPGSYGKKPPFPGKALKPKGPPKTPQLHYCEICKISCAGPQTYREHLEGQKHKKKEGALRAGGASSCCSSSSSSSSSSGGGPRGPQTQLHCELCDVSCTGADAYAAHIRGAKHQKVLKLHTKLGKPIPSTEPTLVSLSPANGPAGKPALRAAPAKPGTLDGAAGKAPAPPEKHPPATSAFAAAKRPLALGSRLDEAKGPPATTTKAPPAEPPPPPLPLGSPGDELLEVQPVGQDYVEEVLNDKGKMVRFHCKLCECSFNDPNAKDMHLKGRRHRLQYKKKVNPELPVEVKPSNRARKAQEEKLRKQQLRALVQRRREEEQRWHLERRRYEEEMYWQRVEEEQLFWEQQQQQQQQRRRQRLAAEWPPPPLMGRPGVPIPPLLPPPRRPSSSDDRHVMAKHASIYPSEEELRAVQTAVSHAERALRLVSNWLAEQEGEEPRPEGPENGKADVPPPSPPPPPPRRALKGVVRVGVLAKGLLLRGDREVRLILLAAQRPTPALLRSIAEQLPRQMEKVTSDGYEVVAVAEEARLVIASCKEPKMQVTVSLTSPLVREGPRSPPSSSGAAPDGSDPAPPSEAPPDPCPGSGEVLNPEKCLESLAALRHAKWFQSRANGLHSCVIVIRVLRDLCRRVPTWSALPEWALELLVERVLSSAVGPLGPGAAMRRVLECMATGVLLPDGPGLQDPCEKEPLDALRTMRPQQREELTASSQHALRLLAFRQIHKVLGMDPLPPAKHRTRSPSRKRPRDEEEEEEASEGNKGKKDRKEEEEREEEKQEQEGDAAAAAENGA